LYSCFKIVVVKHMGVFSMMCCIKIMVSKNFMGLVVWERYRESGSWKKIFQTTVAWFWELKNGLRVVSLRNKEIRDEFLKVAACKKSLIVRELPHASSQIGTPNIIV
jgi:hypothetical protein